MAKNEKFSVYAKINGSPGVAVHGQVATKSHVVALMLDLIGFTPDHPLKTVRLLDPSCGEGAFIMEAARRLVASVRSARELQNASHCLLGIEKDPALVARCRNHIRQVLQGAGLTSSQADKICQQWIVCADFLTCPIEAKFDVVIGNPPYVRQEAIPKDALAQYRKRFSCFYDRADLYVAFFERGLELLSQEGMLAFICPDRFTRNNYGRKLRRLISDRFHVRQVFDLAQASPFEPEVCCYPGIFIIGKQKTKRVDYIRFTHADAAECDEARRAICTDRQAPEKAARITYHRYDTWFVGEQQWTIASPALTRLLRRLESIGPPLGSESSGCRVGIGVATGADSVFIVSSDFSHVEPELLLPLVTTTDVTTGQVNWSKLCVINPFVSGDYDGLINLEDYPRAKEYFLQHEKRLKGRNVAMRNPNYWYRTIDRIYPSLQRSPKLLIPDIKQTNVVAFEKGKLYPHHNLYYVTSQYWDLQALRTILRSSVARFFVWMYGVKMRAGFLRFQAQYLRRICVPHLMTIDATIIRKLKGLNDERNTDAIDNVVANLYSLSDSDLDLIRNVSTSSMRSASAKTLAAMPP